jgi:hypothetical protein
MVVPTFLEIRSLLPGPPRIPSPSGRGALPGFPARSRRGEWPGAPPFGTPDDHPPRAALAPGLLSGARPFSVGGLADRAPPSRPFPSWPLGIPMGRPPKGDGRSDRSMASRRADPLERPRSLHPGWPGQDGPALCRMARAGNPRAGAPSAMRLAGGPGASLQGEHGPHASWGLAPWAKRPPSGFPSRTTSSRGVPGGGSRGPADRRRSSASPSLRAAPVVGASGPHSRPPDAPWDRGGHRARRATRGAGGPVGADPGAPGGPSFPVIASPMGGIRAALHPARAGGVRGGSPIPSPFMATAAGSIHLSGPVGRAGSPAGSLGLSSLSGWRSNSGERKGKGGGVPLGSGCGMALAGRGTGAAARPSLRPAAGSVAAAEGSAGPSGGSHGPGRRTGVAGASLRDGGGHRCAIPFQPGGSPKGPVDASHSERPDARADLRPSLGGAADAISDSPVALDPSRAWPILPDGPCH